MGWTVLTSSDTDVGSSVNDTLMDAIRGNLDYNFDHALRCGTHAAGVRKAVAYGEEDFSLSTPWTTVVSGQLYKQNSGTLTITFSTESDDGNPNFNATPRIWYGFEDADDTDWASNYVIPQFVITSQSSTQFQGIIYALADASVALDGHLWWLAIGDVSTLE